MAKRDKPSISDDEIIASMGSACLLMRSRLISRVITAIHDETLRPLGVGSAQLVLLVVIFQLQPASRAAIGRFHHQDRSTLTRNLQVILSEGWAEEVAGETKGRSRPIALTQAGKDLIVRAAPSWREAQDQTRALLGEAGAQAVTSIADGILRATAL
jgi:DNA-binding MarR family transcriptional regulator